MRRIPLSRRSHVTGFGSFETGLVEHESALERDFALLAAFDDPGARIVSQPTTIRFETPAGQRRYTPDFGVIWSDGRYELVEVKYRADLRAKWSALRPGFATARSSMRAMNGSFRIVTETAIRVPRLDNARRLLPLRKAPLDADLAMAARAIVSRMGTPTLGETVMAMSCDRVMALGTIWRLMARGDLAFDPQLAVGFETRLGVS
ncbi:Tn7 transposase TnsA N-terminal domain-containing protein [Brytella acorum]|uniref:Tn7 transposase TnsA N-terminal domain-containing protein n=1 Tax=Brytella acorum TaxID=2959299 RepID=A0AA35VCR5_9PROT|nr:Tn7 transposase TnsA N-terminal domain-containing protein [Brytella acorum]CAI9121783.1 Tn7 transposase TnsA N-terminal domain-containing protein [Brytella acorum]